MVAKPKNLKDIKDNVATQAMMEGTSKVPLASKIKRPKPKSVTRIGPEDECSYEDVLRQEKDDADARPARGDVPK